MPNTVSGFYQTLVAAASEASAALVGQTKMLDCVYKDYSPVAATPGKLITINIPTTPTYSGGTPNIADIGVGDFTIVDVAHTAPQLNFNKHPGYAYIIRDFEQYNSPTSIRNGFLDAAIKGMAQFINLELCALVTAANFDSYTSITGGADTFTEANFRTAWSNLAGAKVPVRDNGNLFFLTHPIPYAAMLTDDEFTADSNIGWIRADSSKRKAMLGQQWGADVDFDQDFPIPAAGVYAGLLWHRHAIALATRPLPEPDGKVVEYTYVMWKDIPIRVMLGYNQLKAGYVVTLDAGYALGVIRKDHGSFLVTT
jgi:hypothetical protein